MTSYEDTAQEFKRRILEAVPDHPEILEMDDAWHLISKVNSSDLDLTLAQATVALAHAKREYKEAKSHE